MTERLIRAELGKTKTGYRWIQAVPWLNQQKIYPMWFLTDEKPRSELPSQEWSDPVHGNQELFLEFARIKPFEDWTCKEDEWGISPLELDPDSQKKESIRAFANHYRLLTEGELIE